MRRKGELSPAGIDRGWPHQVAIRDDDGQYLGHLPASGPLSSLCERGHNVTDGKHRYPRNQQARHNIGPTILIDIIVKAPAGREIWKVRWGLIPPWHKGTAKQIKPHNTYYICDLMTLITLIVEILVHIFKIVPSSILKKIKLSLSRANISASII